MKHISVVSKSIPVKADEDKGLVAVRCGPLKEILGKCDLQEM